MMICESHWQRLRDAIEERGLSGLISATSDEAMDRTFAELDSGTVTPASFDPLLSAHWAIANNAMVTLGPQSLYLLTEGPEDPVELPGGEGRTWPRCPLCYLGLAHELTCSETRCTLPKVDGYAWMIERAADDAHVRAKELGLLKPLPVALPDPALKPRPSGPPVDPRAPELVIAKLLGSALAAIGLLMLLDCASKGAPAGGYLLSAIVVAGGIWLTWEREPS